MNNFRITESRQYLAELHHPFFCIFDLLQFEPFVFSIYFIEVQLIYRVVLISAVQQSDQLNTYLPYFLTLFHYDISQNIEYSSLCYTVQPHCLSVLYMIACICSSQHFPPHPLPLDKHKSVICVCESVSVFQIISFVETTTLKCLASCYVSPQ